MFAMKSRRTLLHSLLALTVAFPLAACSDDEVEDEPRVATMRLVIGAQTVNVAANGTVTGGPIVIGKVNNALTATFLRADGTPESLVTAVDFELRGTSDNTAVANFTTSALGGTLVGVANGTTQVRFALFHTGEQHNDFGPFPVTVTVQ